MVVRVDYFIRLVCLPHTCMACLVGLNMTLFRPVEYRFKTSL